MYLGHLTNLVRSLLCCTVPPILKFFGLDLNNGFFFFAGFSLCFLLFRRPFGFIKVLRNTMGKGYHKICTKDIILKRFNNLILINLILYNLKSCKNMFITSNISLVLHFMHLATLVTFIVATITKLQFCMHYFYLNKSSNSCSVVFFLLIFLVLKHFSLSLCRPFAKL